MAVRHAVGLHQLHHPWIVGIYAGQWRQRRIDVRWFYRFIYALLFVTGTKLLYDGIRGLSLIS